MGYQKNRKIKVSAARLGRRLMVGAAVPFIFLTATVDAQQLPALGDTSAQITSSLEEERMGRQFMRNARRHLDFSDDPEIVSYIRSLGNRLLESVGLPVDEFHFTVVNDTNLNAFAVPGGFISVHTGLIARTESEAELASVMAHEITHITQRHLARMIERAKQRSIPAVAAMVAAILVGGQVGSAALMGANAALAADQLKYNREFEKEADAIGLKMLAGAGFDPSAMPSFFLKLQKSSSLLAGDVPEYLRTHPLSVNRIAESEARAAGYEFKGSEESVDFFHIRARVQALMSSDSVRQANLFSAQENREIGVRRAESYGEALALMKAGRFDNARSVISQLLKDFPDYNFYRLLEGQIASSAGNAEVAVDIFEDVYLDKKDDPARIRYYAKALMAVERYEVARKILRRWQRLDRQEPGVYELLSRVEGERGRLAEAFQARAEYFAARFEPGRALEELGKARRSARGDFYIVSSIDAREQELQQEMEKYDELTPLR